MKKALILASFLLTGCDSLYAPPHTYRCSGYIRQYAPDTHSCRWNLVIEGDNRAIWTVRGETCTFPPVWVGLHGEFEYSIDENYTQGSIYRDFRVIRRYE